MQNIWLKVRNIMSKKYRIFFHRNSRFHYSLFVLVCGGFAAANQYKRAQTNRSIGAKSSGSFSFRRVFNLRSGPRE